MSKKREYGQLQTVARAVVSPVFKALWQITVEGRENIPTDGPAILCPNHTSVIDSFMLPATLPRRITFVGKAEYLDDWKTRRLFPALGMVPIDRKGGNASQNALDTAERILNDGELFGIYPEGTRSRTGMLHKGHTGPARLALRTGAPIIPVSLVGTRDIQPPDQAYPTPFKSARVSFGKPIDVARYRDRADERFVPRQIIDEVMFEIQKMSGQHYVNEYASKAAPSETTAPIERQAERRDVVESPTPRSSSDVLLAPALV